jgi:salicylate hydroxylase
MSLAGSKVAIVGGGIAGLTSALAFVQKGARVFVFEQAKEFTEVGAGIQITPNAGRALAALGVFDALRARGIVSDAVEPTDGKSGRRLARFDLSSQSPGYLFLHRAVLIDVLHNACRELGVVLQAGSKISDVDISRSRISNQNFDLIVFADGIHSLGRELINGPEKPSFTGQIAWRAVLAGQMPNVAQVAMGARTHLVLYPLDETQINLVAVQEEAAWSADGWEHDDDPINLKAAFADYTPAHRTLIDKVERVRKWGLHRYNVAEVWSRDQAVLIGDAAHPTLPFLAQGANLAIEDAFVLARNCAEQGIAEALATFADIRKPRVVRAIEAANANAANYHATGLRKAVSHVGLQVIGSVAPKAFLNRLSWLYDYDVTK